MGHTPTAADYIARVREFAFAMRAADRSIKIVLVGAHFPIDFPDRDWNRTVLAELHQYVDYISMHHYIGHDYKDAIIDRWPEIGIDGAHEHLTEYMRLLEDAMGIVREDIRLINHEKSSRKRIGIALDEYGPWYKTRGDADEHVEQYPLADALLMGAYFNIFVRNADVLTLANMAQLVNTLPAMVCETGGTGFYRQATSYVQEMFLPAAGAVAVDAWVDGPRRPGSYYPEVTDLDVSAARGVDGRLHVFAVNRSASPLAVDIQVPGGTVRVEGVSTLTAKGLGAANSFETPTAVTPVPLEPAAKPELAPWSVTALVVTLTSSDR